MAAPSTLEIVGKKECMAARIITGCTSDTPKDALMCEAGLTPANIRCKVQATLQHERSSILPEDVPSHKTAKDYAPLRLKRHASKGGAPNNKLDSCLPMKQHR